MKILFIFLVTGALAHAEQGTMSTDKTEASEAPASLSGFLNDKELNEKEIQRQENDDDDPNLSKEPGEFVPDNEIIEKEKEADD